MTPRRYLMCPPTYFAVTYEINPWMDASRPVDTARALEQWRRLGDVFRDLGHTVELIDPEPGLPDMVYAANGATVVDGIAYSARFRFPQRAPEGTAYLKWFADHGFETVAARCINEGEGDLLAVGDVILAGTGFRTDRSAHAEVARVFGRKVVTLELVDPRFYHLDTALTVLRWGEAGTDAEIAYFPAAFSPESQEILRVRFPDAIEAREEDAAVLGMNAVSDGEHIVLNPRATRYAAELRERGYTPIPVDTSELLRGGGGAKCCTLVVRPAPAR